MPANDRIDIKVETPEMVARGISDPGRMRSENQDFILLDPAGQFVLLADGMGGHERGAEASRTALDVIKEYLHPDVVSAELQNITQGSGVPGEIVCLISLVDEAVNKANNVIFERNHEAKLQRFMGTTVVGLVLVTGGYVLWFHVGDSRLYLWREGQLKCLTSDHSAYAEWVRKGQVGQEPGKNVVTRAIGPNAGVAADANWETRQKDDLYILCSDGLTDMLTENQMIDILGGHSDVAAIAENLVDAANSAGGKDNTSVVVCKV